MRLRDNTRMFRNISVREAAELVKTNAGNPHFVILDVRTPEEFGEGHLERAINLDRYCAAFKDELSKLDKGKAYLVYCRSGNRSRQAAKVMKTMRFDKVFHLSGGITSWRASGLAIAE